MLVVVLALCVMMMTNKKKKKWLKYPQSELLCSCSFQWAVNEGHESAERMNAQSSCSLSSWSTHNENEDKGNAKMMARAVMKKMKTMKKMQMTTEGGRRWRFFSWLPVSCVNPCSVLVIVVPVVGFVLLSSSFPSQSKAAPPDAF